MRTEYGRQKPARRRERLLERHDAKLKQGKLNFRLHKAKKK